MTGKIETDYDTGWREGYEAGSGQARLAHDELRDEIERLQSNLKLALDDRDRLRATLARGRGLVEDMDLRMPEQTTEDASGWITSYRIPVGPWHRLLGWSRGG
jgi:hypothetical protein